MNAVDILKGARSIVASHWHKGSMGDGKGNYCALGALDRAANMSFGLTSDALCAAEDALAAHVPGREEYQARNKHPVPAYNDKPTTTLQDILDLFDKTLADLGGLA